MMRARVTSTAIRVVCRRRGHRAARVTTNDMAGSEDDVVDHADRDGRANDDDVHDDVHDDDDDDHDDEKSGSSDSDAENGDGYASDLMGDAADRAALAQMNELEREALLLERAEARKEIESRRQIVALAKTRALELARREAASSTRGISSAKREELEALERVAKAKDRKERAKRVFGGDSDEDEDEAMMDSDSGDEAREVSRAKKAKASSRRRRDVDDDDFSDYEYDEGDESTTPATRAQIDSITLKRHQIEAWVNEPYFESAVTHCLVRVGIGLNKQQENVYRLVEVAGVADGKYKQYSLKTYEYLPGKKTQKWLVLRWGSSEKTFRLSEVSNSPTTSDEWAAWVAHIVDSGSRKITQRDVKVCLENLKEAANYRYTEDDVTRILAEKREKQGSRHKNLLFEKEQVKTKIAQAEAAGDYEALAELEQKKLELQLSITERLNPKGTMEALANINKRNEIKNSEALAKRASEQVARLKRGLTNTGEGDPFSRRPTRLTNYWDMGGKKDAPSEDATAKADAAATTTTTAAAVDHENDDDDIFLTAGVDAQQSENELVDVLQQRHRESTSSLALDLSRIGEPGIVALEKKSTRGVLNRGAALLQSSYDVQRAENFGERPNGKVFSLNEYLALSNA